MWQNVTSHSYKIEAQEQILIEIFKNHEKLYQILKNAAFIGINDVIYILWSVTINDRPSLINGRSFKSVTGHLWSVTANTIEYTVTELLWILGSINASP